MPSEWTAALTFILVTNFTPGPNNILSGSMGALHGFRRTLPFMLGVATGFCGLALACAGLSTALTAWLPSAAPVLRVIGAAYILYLAYGVYRSSSTLLEPGPEAKPLPYWTGVSLQLVNPKGAFFGLTVYSVFLSSLIESRVVLLLTPPLLAAVAFTAVCTWAATGQVIRRAVNTPLRARVLGVVLAGALVWTAVDLLGVFGR